MNIMCDNHERSNKSGREIWVSLILAIAGLFIMLLLGATYETNDDWSIALQLSRGEVAISSFQSPYLALFISKLYLTLPSLPWWGILAFGAAGSVLWVSFYIIFRSSKGIQKYILLFGTFVLIWLVGIKQINFTRTAMLFTIAGCLLCAFYIQKREHKIKIVLGCIGIIIGGMIRFQAALVIIPFFLVLVLYSSIILKTFKTHKYVLLIGGFAPIVVLLCLYTLNNIYLNSHSEWKAYNEYNYKRGIIQDYANRYPAWEEASEEYEKLGVVEGDEQLFLQKWFSEDTEVFNEETLEGISNLSSSKVNFSVVADNLFQQLGKNIIFWMFIIFSVAILVEYRKKAVLLTMILGLMGIGVITYFCIQGRIQNRVSEPVILCAILFLYLGYTCMKQVVNRHESSYSISIAVKSLEKSQKNQVNKMNISVFSIFVSIFSLMLLFYSIKDNLKTMHIPYFDEGKNSIVRQKTDYIDSTEDRIYLLTVLSDEWDKGYNMWENVPVGYCENMFFLGGWSARTPYNIEKLENMDIENPAKALIEKENVYSVFDTDILSFLKRHYDTNITCTRVDTFKDDYDTSIVQYTSPKDKPSKMDGNISKINIDISEYREYDQNATWTLEGKIDFTKSSEYKNLYCNVKSNNKLYSFRLQYQNGYFSGDMYEFNTLLDTQISECYLIGENSMDEYVYIGEITDLIE